MHDLDNIGVGKDGGKVTVHHSPKGNDINEEIGRSLYGRVVVAAIGIRSSIPSETELHQARNPPKGPVRMRLQIDGDFPHILRRIIDPADQFDQILLRVDPVSPVGGHAPAR